MSTVIKPKRSETPNQIPGASALAVHELAMNVTDGKLYTKTSGNVVKEVGGAGAVSLQTVTDGGAVTDNDITWHARKVRITTIGFARLRNLPFEYVKGEMAYDKQILMNVVKVICLIMKSTINILKVSASM